MNFCKEEYNLPGYIDATNFKFIKFDNKYLMGIIIKKFPSMFSFLEVMKAIPKNEVYDLSIFISKKDTSKILKEISYYISASSSEERTASKNQLDIDLLNKTKQDAKELRKSIQVDGEEVFYINIIVTLIDKNKNELLRRIKSFQSKLYSKGIFSNILNFRHLDAYKLTLPLGYTYNKILEKDYINITTSALSYIFPFYTNNIFDEDGIIFGYTLEENKLCNINVFDKKYTNSNICIFGSSGSGKSYFTKLNIIRNYLNNISQYVFDLEGEYVNIAKKLGIEYLSIFNDTGFYYNLFEIYNYELNEYANYLENKVDELVIFIGKLCDINDNTQLDELKKSIYNMYSDFKITSDKNSLFGINGITPLESEYYPTFFDLIRYIKSRKLKKLIQEKIIDKFYFLTKHSNINLSNKLLIFEIGKVTDKSLHILNYFLEKIKNITKRDEKTLLYIDEVWKYISKKDSFNIGQYIFELYKTIRKSNAGIVTITQDISDFFSYEDGNYGKSILNNSSFKIFFKIDYTNISILSKLALLNEDVIKSISRLNKGQALIVFANNTFVINIKANEYEKEIIDEQ